MIVERIEAYLRSENKQVDEKILTDAASRMRNSVKRQLMEQTEFRGIGLSTSLFCLRRAKYTQLKVAGLQAPPRSYLTRLGGDLFETAILTLAKLAGCQIGIGQAEVSLETPIGTIKGHIDDLLWDEAAKKYWIVEIKSVTQQGMEEFTSDAIGWACRKDYMGQAMRYAAALTDVEGVVFVAVCRDTGKMSEAPVVFDKQTVEQSLNQYLLLSEAKTPEDLPRGVEAEDELEKVQGKAAVPPEKLDIATRAGAWYSWPTGRKCLNWKCGYCPWREKCWQGEIEEVEVRGGKPKWVLREVAR
jgi:hypothetical protein